MPAVSISAAMAPPWTVSPKVACSASKGRRSSQPSASRRSSSRPRWRAKGDSGRKARMRLLRVAGMPASIKPTGRYEKSAAAELGFQRLQRLAGVAADQDGDPAVAQREDVGDPRVHLLAVAVGGDEPDDRHHPVLDLVDAIDVDLELRPALAQLGEPVRDVGVAAVDLARQQRGHDRAELGALV